MSADGRVTRAAKPKGFGVRQIGLDEIGKLQVFEQDVEELIPCNGEAELVLPVAVRRALAALPLSTALRALQLVAYGELLVAGKDATTLTAGGRENELRLADGFCRYSNCFNRSRDPARSVS